MIINTFKTLYGLAYIVFGLKFRSFTPMKKALVNLNFAVILWGFTGVLGKLIQLNEGWLVWYRLLFSAVTVWLLNFKLKEIERIPFKNIITLCITGGLQGLHWVFFFGSVHYANVSVALICLSSAALFTSLMEPLLSRKRVVATEVLLGLLGMAGIYLVFQFEGRFKTGIILGVLSALFISVTPVLNKRFLQQHHPSTITAWNMTGGWLVLCPLLPVYLHFFPEGNSLPSFNDILWLLVLACICTVFTWRLALNALKKLSAFTLNLMLNLEPIYGIGLAFIVFNEYKELGPYFYIGFLLIMVSILLHAWRLMKHKAH
jgi:drug/metabolite transporter (DMT)-like permease